MDEKEKMLAVSTINNAGGGNTLSRVLIMKLDNKGQLLPYCQKRFNNQKPNSMYFYLNFEY
jgi:hypothetical protein